MTQTFVTVAVFVLLLALLPLGIKWLQARGVATGGVASGGSRVLSAVAVGPNQRVVTVEVGPAHDRTWLVLGVTAQSISCLHTMGAADAARPPSCGSQVIAGPQG